MCEALLFVLLSALLRDNTFYLDRNIDLTKNTNHHRRSQDHSFDIDIEFDDL